MSDTWRLIRKWSTARRAIETMRKLLVALQRSMTSATVVALSLSAMLCSAQQLTNGTLSMTVKPQDGSYEFGPVGSHPTLQSSIGALVDHKWLHSGSYPSHSVSESQFNDALGSGRQLTVTCSGLRGSPDLIYTVQLYDQNPYGTVQVWVKNGTGQATSVQAIRSVEASGDPILNLGGLPSDERVLSDSFSERLARLGHLHDLRRVSWWNASRSRKPTYL